MSGHSGSTSTNNVSQDPTTIFAAPHPPARKDATVDGASVPSAQKVYTLDEEDMDDSDRAWLAQMRKKHEASKEFTAKQDQLLKRKETLQATKVAANRKFETDTAQLVSTPNFECIHTLPTEKMGSVVHTCTDIVTKAMDTLKEQTKSLLEGTEIVHNDLSAEEVRKLGLLTLQLTVQRELAVFSSDVEIKKIDDELHDLRTAHDRKMAEFRNAPQAGPDPILPRLSTDARAEQKAKEMVDANMRKTWTFLKEQGTSEAMLRTAFPQFYTDAPVVDRDDEAKKQQAKLPKRNGWLNKLPPKLAKNKETQHKRMVRKSARFAKTSLMHQKFRPKLQPPQVEMMRLSLPLRILFLTHVLLMQGKQKSQGQRRVI